jgi:hypothetical protein
MVSSGDLVCRQKRAESIRSDPAGTCETVSVLRHPCLPEMAESRLSDTITPANAGTSKYPRSRLQKSTGKRVRDGFVSPVSERSGCNWRPLRGRVAQRNGVRPEDSRVSLRRNVRPAFSHTSASGGCQPSGMLFSASGGCQPSEPSMFVAVHFNVLISVG